MERIRQLFEQYSSNYVEWNEIEQQLLLHKKKEEWIEQLEAYTVRRKELYRENNVIIAEILDLLKNHPNDEIMQIAFDQTLEMYYADSSDLFILLEIYDVLIPYYEEKQDDSKIILLNNEANYCLCESRNVEYLGEAVDLSYNEKVRKYLFKFFELSDQDRFQVLLSYYYYFVIIMGFEMISLDDLFDAYEEYRSYIEKNEIEKYIEDNEKAKYILRRTYQGFLATITKLGDMNEGVRKKLYHYAKEYMDCYKQERRSDYELSSIEYAAFLFLGYEEKKETAESVFDKYYDYVEHLFLMVRRDEITSEKDIVDSINAENILTQLAEHIQDQERIQRMVKVLTYSAEGRWAAKNVPITSNINYMLFKMCVSIYKFDTAAMINKEKTIMQLVIQRNKDVYINGCFVSEIALAIYDEITTSQIGYFDAVEQIPRMQLKDFIRQACMFYDIGRTGIVGATEAPHRNLVEIEKNRYFNHTQFGAKLLEDIPQLETYEDVIHGHHKYYDGQGGFPACYDNTKSKIKPIVDLITLAVALNEETNPYSDFSKKKISFTDFIQRMKKDSGTKFSPELVDLIMNSIFLREKLEAIVMTNRKEHMYDIYNNWNKIQLSQDESSIIKEINEKVGQFVKSGNEKGFEPYKEIMINLAYNAQDDYVRGQALFDLMVYYRTIGDFYAAKAIENETTNVLDRAGNIELIVKNYLNQGLYEEINNNYEGALIKYFTTVEYALGRPECESDLCKAYINISSVYMNLNHFQHALKYFNLAENIVVKDSEEEINILCGKGFCLLKMNQLEDVKRYRSRVVSYMETHSGKFVLAINVYLAWFAYALHLSEELEKYLKLVFEESLKNIQFTYYTAEILQYFELLEELKKYDELVVQLDHYLEVQNEGIISEQIYSRLIQDRIHCAIILEKTDDVYKYGRLLRMSRRKANEERANQMENIEEDIIQNVGRQVTHSKILQEHKILEEGIIVAKNESEQKSNFLSSMSHEIRTPINGIIGLNEMILRTSKEEKTLRYASDIHNSSKHLLGIINDILDFSKMEAGRMDLEPQKYDLKEMLRNLNNMFESKMREKNLAFHMTCDTQMPHIFYGDDQRIQQILLNLVSNAYKYTHEGSVDIEVNYRKNDEKTVIVRFIVKDTGIGLKEEQIEKIAVPFERFDNVKNRGIEGTGLGMAIVTNLLKMMDSKLEVSSEYGKGSTFAFEIEQEVIDWEKIESLENNDTKIIATDKALFEAPDTEILVVDDNEINLLVAEGVLERTKCKVTLAASGKECLELCQKKVFHVILMDHMMPEMDGIETLQHIREEDGPNKKTPVIVVTANAMNGANEFYRNNGFDAVVIKPLKFTDLERTLKAFLPETLLMG